MKTRNSLSGAIRALIELVKTLLKKMPVLFLVFIYIIDLLIRGYQSKGFSTIYIIGILIALISICIYITTKSLSETTLSFVLGLLTVYSINWNSTDIGLFMILYLLYIVCVFYIYVIRLSMEQESILIQAACKLDIDDYKKVYKRLKKISETSTRNKQLSIIDKCEIIRYLSFRQIIIGEYEEAINIIELFKVVCQADLVKCCEIYYGLYIYCYNKKPCSLNISKEIETMFDKITNLSMSYTEFFEVFTQTKRILVEKKMTYDHYIRELEEWALEGYSYMDMIDMLKSEYLV